MSDRWHAFDVVGESVGKTKDLLFKPFRISLWLKLAFIVFLINGGINAGLNVRSRELSVRDINLSQYLPIIIATLVLLFIIILLFLYVGSVSVFVFLESVIQKRVEIFDGLHRNLGRGLKLFLFNIFLSIIAFFVVLILILPAVGVYMSLSGSVKYAVLMGYGLIALVLFIIVLIVFVVVGMFTTDFVVPIMIRKKGGILDSWRHLIGILKKNKGQFLMYVIARILLGVVTGIISVIVAVIMLLIIISAALIVGFAIGVVGVRVFSTASLVSLLKFPLVWVILGLILLFVALIFAYIIILLTLPIPVFYRYYSLLFIARITPELDFFGKEEGKDKREESEGKTEEDIYVEVNK